MEYFEYNGKTFPFKSVYFQNEEQSHIISCEELNSELLNNLSNYDSEYAKIIDEKIFFFVPLSILNETDKIIEKYVNEVI